MWLSGPGGFTFASARSDGRHSSSAVAPDLNADGSPDLVVANLGPREPPDPEQTDTVSVLAQRAAPPGETVLWPFAGFFPPVDNRPALNIANAERAALEETVNPGSSELSYDSGSDRYQYVLKKGDSWAGTCRQFVLKLRDGSTHRVNFKLK